MSSTRVMYERADARIRRSHAAWHVVSPLRLRHAVVGAGLGWAARSGYRPTPAEAARLLRSCTTAQGDGRWNKADAWWVHQACNHGAHQAAISLLHLLVGEGATDLMELALDCAGRNAPMAGEGESRAPLVWDVANLCGLTTATSSSALVRPCGRCDQYRTPAVRGLAGQIRSELRVELAPVLADALEDADCPLREAMDHLRLGGCHGPSCWVLDCVLGEAVPGDFMP